MTRGSPCAISVRRAESTEFGGLLAVVRRNKTLQAPDGARLARRLMLALRQERQAESITARVWDQQFGRIVGER
jgi:hypothetical protein